MVSLRNGAEGYANGATVTVGTSGGASGDAFSSGHVAVGPSSLLQASTDHPGKGLVGFKYSAVSGETSMAGWGPIFNHKNCAAQIDGHYLTTLPSAGYGVIQFRDNTGGTCTIQQRTDGKFEVYDDVSALVTGSTSTSSSGTSGAITTGTKYVLDARVEVGVGTTDGKVYVRAARSSDGTVDANIALATGVNLGANAITDIRFFKVGSSGVVSNAYGDNVAAADNVTAFLAAATNTPPTISAGPDIRITAGSTLLLSASGSDPDGTVTSWLWSKLSGPSVSITNAATQNASVAAIPIGHYVFQVTGTDNDGAPVSDTVAVYSQGLVVVPDSESSNSGAWTNVGGAASRTAAVADALTTTYMESPDNPSGAINEQVLQPLKSGQTGYDYTAQVDATTPARSVTVELRVGATVIASETRSTTDVTTPLSTSWQAYTLELNPTQMSALSAAGTDDLRLRTIAN